MIVFSEIHASSVSIYHKFVKFVFIIIEMFGALLTIFLGWIVAAFLSYYAIERIVYHDYEIEGDAMVLTAGFCLMANVL